MDIDSPFTMVVLIVLIAVGSGVLNNYLKLRANREDDRASDADIARMEADIARLKERVRVLEKITTDGDQRLREEISRLA